MIDYEIDTQDRELLAKIAKALAYWSWGVPLKDFLEHEDITNALMLLMRVTPSKDSDMAVNSFVAAHRLSYEESPSDEMINAARGHL